MSKFSCANCFCFFFNDTATTEIYTLSLHDALPISQSTSTWNRLEPPRFRGISRTPDRKSTRLNSSHANISYAVFCLKKNNTNATKLKLSTPEYGDLDYFPTRKFMLTYNPAKINFFFNIPAPPKSTLFPLNGALQV